MTDINTNGYQTNVWNPISSAMNPAMLNGQTDANTITDGMNLAGDIFAALSSPAGAMSGSIQELWNHFSTDLKNDNVASQTIIDLMGVINQTTGTISSTLSMAGASSTTSTAATGSQVTLAALKAVIDGNNISSNAAGQQVATSSLMNLAGGTLEADFQAFLSDSSSANATIVQGAAIAAELAESSNGVQSSALQNITNLINQATGSIVGSMSTPSAWLGAYQTISNTIMSDNTSSTAAGSQIAANGGMNDAGSALDVVLANYLQNPGSATLASLQSATSSYESFLIAGNATTSTIQGLTDLINSQIKPMGGSVTTPSTAGSTTTGSGTTQWQQALSGLSTTITNMNTSTSSASSDTALASAGSAFFAAVQQWDGSKSSDASILKAFTAYDTKAKADGISSAYQIWNATSSLTYMGPQGTANSSASAEFDNFGAIANLRDNVTPTLSGDALTNLNTLETDIEGSSTNATISTDLNNLIPKLSGIDSAVVSGFSASINNIENS
jgi:hypothetical protein